ncbi:hypothetical protein FACS189425_08800 [Clostridia bacterium]|nr:hypothetical protein FACS189425_08800 [Clostridia bacterium]
MTNFDDTNFAVKVFGERNEIKLDDTGMPSIMVGFPKLNAADVIPGAVNRTLPGFIVNAVEKDLMYQSKYINIVRNGRAYSLPGEDPANTINFDNSLAACRQKGAGWGLTPFSLWAAIALYCKANGFQPRGNTNYGASHENPWEKGIPGSKETSGLFRVLRTLTGSGEKSWYHNNDLSGIADLCGLVWEWLGGFRTLDGEMQFIPNADSMLAEKSMIATSLDWRAVTESGSYVDPGSDGTLKFNGTNPISIVKTVTSTTAQSTRPFATIAAGADITAVPQLLKELAIAPADATPENYNGDAVWLNMTGERLPSRGGGWYDGASAGVFALGLDSARSYVSSYIGFRAAFCDL